MSISFADTDLGQDTSIFTSTVKAPVCEALPSGRFCYRLARYSALVTPHGCPRDHKMILLCQQCYDTIHGGSICALCSNTVIFIVRAVSL